METISPSACAPVLEVLLNLLEDRTPRVGAHGVIGAAQDALRMSSAPAEHIAWADKAAITLVRLEAAIRDGNAATEAAMRDEVQALLQDWVEDGVKLTLQPRRRQSQQPVLDLGQFDTPMARLQLLCDDVITKVVKPKAAAGAELAKLTTAMFNPQKRQVLLRAL